VADIFREVDEELRRERAEKLWKKYGSYVVGVAAGIVVATAAYVGWQEYTLRQRLADGQRYATALAQVRPGNEAAGADALALAAEETSSGYATLARLRAAALRAESGDVAQAVALYDALADDDDVDDVYRDLALLLSVMHQMQGGDSAALRDRLAPLTADDNPWRFSALEVSGFLAFRSGDGGRAREIFTRLADDAATPQGLRARAAEMLAILGG
jgi:hypothetical protein